MAAIEWAEEDYERVAALAAGGQVARLLGELPPDQREAVRAHVVDEHTYERFARA
jgi:DNA-directed RNA polymerase specialized sigma24 family protein